MVSRSLLLEFGIVSVCLHYLEASPIHSLLFVETFRREENVFVNSIVFCFVFGHNSQKISA